METPSESCYLSAATSPRSLCSLEDSLNFYSAPTSPTSEASNILLGFKTGPTTPTRSLDREFEFEASLRFEVKKAMSPRKRDSLRGRSGKDSQPLMMAFADELFCDGKGVPLDPPLASTKLKLPPGFRGGGRSGVMAEPRSPRSVLRRPVAQKCLWNDDFDPFMAALETVREGEKLEGKSGRRARSLSPQRAGPNCVDPDHSGKPNGSVSARWAGPRKKWGEEEKSPARGDHAILAEPKGVVFARRVRLVKMGQERLGEPTASPAQTPKSAKGKWGFRESIGSYTRGNKREKIMKLLFRVSSSGRGSGSSDEEINNNKKQKHQSGDSWKPTFLRRFGFRPIGETQYDKRLASQFAKITLVQYRPRLSLCMGYYGKYGQ